jgi:DNA-binding SARP family transcriptional activator
MLGALEVARDGHEVAVSGVRRRALLVRLVVSANEVVPTGRLVEDIWEEAPPPGEQCPPCKAMYRCCAA